MAKVIVERPRLGVRSAGKRKPGRTRVVVDDDGEPLRAREPARAKPQKTKSLNENLNPLNRYLARNTGRPWNKVYSEISEHLRPTSTVQQHVRDHLEDFVATKTRMKGGAVVVARRWGGEAPIEEIWSPYYVHPRTGLLLKNKNAKRWNARQREARKREEAARALRMRVIDAKTEVHLFGGVWWEVKVAKAGDRVLLDVVVSAGLSDIPTDTLYARPGLRAAAKRILSKAEKKKLGLR
ncbi:MAG: hypothetical protein QM759_07285 [Terricaulis sp.]